MIAWRVLTAVLLSALVVDQTAGQPPGASRPGPAIRVDLNEDLDCMRAAEQLEAALAEAAALNASVVVLELNGNAARLDVVHRMAAALREARVPVAAWLEGGDDARVGIGQLTLSLFADRTIAADRLEVHGSARGDIDALAPDKTAWDGLTVELADWLSLRLGRRGANSDLERVLTSPPDGLWLVNTGTGARLHVGADRPDGATDLTTLADGVRTVRMSGANLRAASLADASARDWRSAAKSLGITSERVERRTIGANLRAARAEAESLLDSVEAPLLAADKALDLADPKSRSVAPSRYRSAAAEARASLARANASLDRLDAILLETPEVFRTPAPGQSKAERISTFGTKWRSMIRAKRDRSERLETKARLFAGQ
ncbi:hypothetical protein PHYC_03868 [Phycisphaerales bacterium]|nr:hypothetical protein PHYC_03868 [Phycisphaerales bacterium]